MAIYFMSVQIIGRSAGRSAVAAAAYRSAERILDERTGLVHDFTRRRGAIETEIFAPAVAPAWVFDRAQLWNAVEAAENRCNSQLAKEVLVALPKELSPQEQRELVREFVTEQFVNHGLVADAAYHWNEGNPHVHILITTRVMGAEGFGAKLRAATKEQWQNRGVSEMERWRAEWARLANRALERAGVRDRIDHRSHERQGNELVPQVHLGPSASAMERRGIRTDKGEHNAVAREYNEQVIELQKARAELQRARAEKVVMARYGDRVRAGWQPVMAKALAQLELEQDGRGLDRGAVEALQLRTRHALQQGDRELQRLAKEGERLRSAEAILQNWNRETAVVRGLQRPLSVVKRWFSQRAQAAYSKAREQLKGTEQSLQRYGVRNAEDLAEQRHQHAWETGRIADIQAEQQRRHERLTLIQQALEGFDRELSRNTRRSAVGRTHHRERTRELERER